MPALLGGRLRIRERRSTLLSGIITIPPSGARREILIGAITDHDCQSLPSCFRPYSEPRGPGVFDAAEASTSEKSDVDGRRAGEDMVLAARKTASFDSVCITEIMSQPAS